MMWFDKTLTIESLQSFNQETMAQYLGMEWVALGADYLKMSMPVSARTRQPYGLLHGGASCALAETIGSVGSHLLIDPAAYMCVGLEINANHLLSAKDGKVTATARPVHVGKSTHVWDIRICDEAENLVCISRLTVAILPVKR